MGLAQIYRATGKRPPKLIPQAVIDGVAPHARMASPPAKVMTHEEEAAALAAQAVALFLGTSASVARTEAKPKPVAAPTHEDEVARLAAEAVRLYRGEAA